MVLNVVVSFVPTDVTAVTITTEISAAISPYSMAFAPELSFKKRRNSSLILTDPVLLAYLFSCDAAIHAAEWQLRVINCRAVHGPSAAARHLTADTNAGGRLGRDGPIATFLHREKQQALFLSPTNHPLTLTRR